MAISSDLRRADRKNFNRPEIALLSFQMRDEQYANLFINVKNYSVQGALIRSEMDFDTGCPLTLIIKNLKLEQWDSFFCRVVWRQQNESSRLFNIGLEFLFPCDTSKDAHGKIHNGFSPRI